MAPNRDLPFEVGQEVEAKFTESGFRGAWFRCKILEKTTTAEPSLLLKYLDFPDEVDSWAPVRHSYPAIKLDAWWTEKHSCWMVRPKPAIVHESDVEDYRKKVCAGQELSRYAHVYTHTYKVGDHVDWWVDDCYWSARIIKIDSETKKAKLRFPPPPHGEGKTDTAPLESLRPSFSWSPTRQWRQMGLKKSEPRKGIRGYTSYRLSVQLVYFSGDLATPTVVPDDLCDPFSPRDAISGSEPEIEGVPVNSRSTSEEGRHNSHQLVVYSNGVHEESQCIPVPSESTLDSGCETKQLVVYTRSVAELVKQKRQLGNKSSERDVTCRIEETPEVLKEEKCKRKVLCNVSFIMPDSDEEDLRSSTPRIHLAANGALSSKPDSEIGSEHELLNPPTTHSVRLDASSNSPLPLASSPTEGEMDSSAARASADDLTGELENIGSFVKFNTTPEHLRSGTAVGFENIIATSREDLSQVEFVISDAAAENAGAENAVSAHCTASNAHDRNDSLSEAADIVENPEQCHDPGNGDSEVIGKGCELKFDGSDLGVAAMCSAGAGLKHGEDAGLLNIVLKIFEDNKNALHNLYQQQATGGPTKDVSVSLSGQMKLLRHSSCVAIKKALNIGRSRKRRRETDQLLTNPQWVRQNEAQQRVDSSGFQTVGHIQEHLSSSAPPTPINNDKRMYVMECVVKPEPVISEPEITTLVVDDSIREPLRVLALPGIHEEKCVAVENPTPSTAPNDTEHRRRPVTDESGPEFELDALERLAARVHVLGAQLHRHKLQTRKKVVWKIGKKNMFSSGSGEGPLVDAEANDVNDTSHSWVCLDFHGWYRQSAPAKALDEEAGAANSDPDHVPGRLPLLSAKATITPQVDPDMRQFPRDSSVIWGSKPRSRRKFTKRGNVLLKFNCGFKRKLSDITEPKEDCKKMKVDASPTFVEDVQKSATPVAEVCLPRMRGSVQYPKHKPDKSMKSKTSQKRVKSLDAIIDRKEMLSSVDFEQEQQSESLRCGRVEQKLVGNSSLSGLPTMSHLSSGSNHGISSPGKEGSEAMVGESNDRQKWHQGRGNSDTEVLDNESEENKVKLQPNGKFWCIKTCTVDGKLEWIGNFPTKEAALSFHDVLNESPCLRVKEVPPLSPSSVSCLGEGADGDNLSSDRVVNEKQLKRSSLERNSKCNASEFSSTAVEPNAGSAVSFVEEANGMAADISGLEKSSGVDEQKDEDQNAGTLGNVGKPVEAHEQQESSAISIKEATSIGMRVKAESGFSMEGNVEKCRSTQGEEAARNLTTEALVSSCMSKVVNVDRGIQSGVTVDNKNPVEVEVSQSLVVAPAESYIHDSVNCQSGRDALDRVSVNVFATAEEMEAACQAKLALWRGICCSPQVIGLQGLDLFERVQLWQSRMHFQDVIDGDVIKALLGTGKSGEEIYVGHFKTAKEVDAVRKVLQRCKKEFARTPGLFGASGNQQVTSGVPSLTERQANVNFRKSAIPPCSASVQNVITLEDDDENEMDATPIPSMLPSSAHARAFTGAIPVGAISSRAENSLSIPASRTNGQSNGVDFPFPRHIQERCHVTGASPAGESCVRQTVPISVQAGDTGMGPFQNVGQGSEIYGRAQPLKEGRPGSHHSSITPSLVGNAVVQGHQVNRYGETVHANIVNSSGGQAEIPSGNLRAFQAFVRGPTPYVPENQLRAVGGFSSLPTLNSSTATALTSIMGRRFYNCCPGTGCCDEDFMLFKALRCRACNHLMHTECALASGRLRLRRNLIGQELACYECACGRPWGIVPIILNRMKEFIEEIWRQQPERLNQDPNLAHPVRLVDLRKGRELCVIMEVLHKILIGAKTDPMRTIFGYIANIGRAIFVDANRVDYLEWLTFVNNAQICLGAVGHANPTTGHC